MVLTTADMVSGIVGLQPIVSMRYGEAAILCESFQHADQVFNAHYSFLEAGREGIGYMPVLVNDRAAENVLRTYQRELGISVPDRPLEKDELLSTIISLVNSPDAESGHLASGLLSGFPLEDCRYVVDRGRFATPGLPLKVLRDVDKRLVREKLEGDLDPSRYTRGVMDDFLPDTRSWGGVGGGLRDVNGFGLQWLAPSPPRRRTLRACQKLIQVDRELGLIHFAERQRRRPSLSRG